MYSQEVEDGRIYDDDDDDDKLKQIFKTLKDMEGSKIDYSKLVYRAGDNEYFDFTRFGPLSSVCFKVGKWIYWH